MKKRGPAGEGRDRRPKIRPLAAFLLAAALAVAAVQIPGAAAKAVESDRACSLAVRPYSTESGFADDLKADEVAIDLYQVADAVKVPGYDTYGYEVKDGYGELSQLLTGESLQTLKAEDWEALAQTAAKAAMGDGTGTTGKAPDVTGAVADKLITKYNGEDDGDLMPGLYLIVARPVDAGPGIYTTRPVAAAEGAEAQEPADTEIVTEIPTVRYTYSFRPELISLPGKAPDEAGSLNTANPGDWIYENVEATMKPSREQRKGSLEIVKTLADQSLMTEEATFVFQVDAYLDEDGDGEEEHVYGNVVGMTFTRENNKSVTLADVIPVGARVVVKEVYTGASYEISGDPSQEGTLEAADQALSMTFTNTGNDRHRGGSGIENSFTYSGGNGWEWNADPAQPGAGAE